MALLQAFLLYFVQFIIYIGIAIGGIALGKKLRENKNRKDAESQGEE